MKMLRRPGLQGVWAMLTAMALLMPLSLPFAQARVDDPRQFGRQPGNPQGNRPGMSGKQKLMLLSGAALLYFLWKKHQANQATKANPAVRGQVATNGRTPQLYRSKNGGIYYRDAQGRPVWLTVPQQGVQIPREEVVRYAPDWNQYQGPAPAAPRGYQTQAFSEFNNGLLSGPRN